MLKAPYLIVGFDVHPQHPQPADVMRRAREALPAFPQVGPLGVENVFYVQVAPSKIDAAYRDVARALFKADQASGGGLRWFVQLCGASDLVGG
jgi:hypothetical protein